MPLVIGKNIWFFHLTHLPLEELTCFLLAGNIKLPERVQEAMQMQVEAERKKRAKVLESEGVREAAVSICLQRGQNPFLFWATKSFDKHA